MNSRAPRASIAVGGRLPDITLPALPDGAATRVARQGRLATVLVILHGTDCVSCVRYLESLIAGMGEFRDWDGRLLAVLPREDSAAARFALELDAPGRILIDAEGMLAERLGLGGSAVVVADQWGEVFFVRSGGAGHELPAAGELAEWARFLTIQCPECQGEAL